MFKAWPNARRNSLYGLMCLVFVGLIFTAIKVDSQKESVGSGLRNKSEIARRISGLNIPFVSNMGQTDESVKFYAKTFGGNVFITNKGEIVYSLPKLSNDGTCKAGVVLKEQLVGSTITEVTGQKRAETKISYFQGNDESKWQSAIPSYEYVSLGEVYKGIDVRLKAYGNNIEKYFSINPGANPQEIKVKIDGAKALKINKDGQLCVETDLGEVAFTKPVAYQDVNGSKEYVEIAYAVQGDQYSFSVGDYDRNNTLVVDPLLASTFLGTDVRRDQITDIAINQWGDVYVVGVTTSYTFPTTPGAYDETSNYTYYTDNNMFISKFSKDLTTLIASTFLGNIRGHLTYSRLVLDGVGNVYVSTETNYGNFPTTPGAYRRGHSGDLDVVVAKLDRDLTTLIASTFIGGSAREFSHDIALDRNGNIYVVGQTKSTDFPTSPGAYDETFNINPAYPDVKYHRDDLFISKFDNNLSTLISSTYLGGINYDAIFSVSRLILSDSGFVYVAGTTASSDFPTTPGAYDVNYNGGIDVVISKFDSDLTTLVASTFFGGTGTEGRAGGLDMAMSRSGNIYIAGTTESSNLPIAPGAYDNTFNDGYIYNYARDAFVAAFNGDLTNLLASTFIGGDDSDSIEAIELDAYGNVYVAGATQSSVFPTTQNAYDTSLSGDWDGFIAYLDNDLTNLKFSSFLGGNSADIPENILVDRDKNVWVAGYTHSANFPTTPDAYDDTSVYRGHPTGFISKLDPELSAAAIQPIGIRADYEYVLYEGDTALNSTELINRNDIARVVTVEVFSSDNSLTVSLPNGSSVDLLERETKSVSLSVDATSASAGTYDLQLKVTDIDGNVSFANVKTYVVAGGSLDLPDLSVTSKGVFFSIPNPDIDQTVTILAEINNHGNSLSENVSVEFFDEDFLIGQVIIGSIQPHSGEFVSFDTSFTEPGLHLIRVVVDGLNDIEEIDEDNNEASKLLSIGDSPDTTGSILVTGKRPSVVIAGGSFKLTGHAAYEIYMNDIRNIDYDVKGGAIQVTIEAADGSQWVYPIGYTDTNGNFVNFAQAPAVAGIYSITIEVGDETFTGRLELPFEVLPQPPVSPPLPPTSTGSGSWISGGGAGGYSDAWVWSEPPVHEPIIEKDVFIHSEDIYFSNNNPSLDEEITIVADIRYWASDTAVKAEDVPVNLYVTYPGLPKIKIGETFIDSISVADPDFGSSLIYAGWKNIAGGVYIIEVEIDPSYLEENLMNNAATRAIIVGELQAGLGVVSGHVMYPWGAASGVIITLIDADGNVTETLTGATGSYLFTEAPVGECQVKISTPAGYDDDTDGTGVKTTSVSANAISIVDFLLTVGDAQGPIAKNIIAELNPTPISGTFSLTAEVDDSTTGNSSIASAEYSIDDGVNWSQILPVDGSFDNQTEGVTAVLSTPDASGVYEILVRGTDVYDNIGSPESLLLVVYNPEGGFVTGGGWIWSPAGAYSGVSTLEGKANFGFVSKYKKGATIPTGETEFQFKVAGLNFHFSSYQWLVVAGAKAQFKGIGNINGSGNYGFMLTVVDAKLTPRTSSDLFRIKIWDKSNDDSVVYDNQMDRSDDAELTTAISGGNIVIHKDKKKKKDKKRAIFTNATHQLN